MFTMNILDHVSSWSQKTCSEYTNTYTNNNQFLFFSVLGLLKLKPIAISIYFEKPIKTQKIGRMPVTVSQ